jgi:hypothetical protein
MAFLVFLLHSLQYLADVRWVSVEHSDGMHPHFVFPADVHLARLPSKILF